MFCSKCGKELREDDAFCDACGTKINGEKEIITSKNISTSSQNIAEPEEGGHAKCKLSYLVSALGTIVSLIVRFSKQEVYRIGDIVNRRNVYCLDPDLKPLFSLIPGLALIFAALIIVSDKKSTAREKLSVFIVNMIFIVASVLLVWLNFPTNDWY